MNLKNIFLALVSFAVCFSVATAQEIILPLKYNHQIKNFRKIHPSFSTLRTSFVNDTLGLPFVDDFSRQGIYPTNTLWTDSDAFINSTFCDNPITVGVATLDGIDKYGNPYDNTILTNASVVCDSLKSKPINLALTVADSVYFTFFYQPQGFGDRPEKGDSLCLAFRNSGGAWISVWNDTGKTDSPFKRIDIKISDANYLYNGFQFCFYNYATPNGNRDHWNIDYVWLNRFRSAGDLNYDNGFKNNPTTLLKDFTSMPWSHYKSLSLSDRQSLFKTSFIDSVYDFGYGPTTTLFYAANIFDDAGANVFTQTANPQNVAPGVVDSFETALSSFSLPVNTNESTVFVTKNYFTQSGSASYSYNDTNYYHQKFSNYYSYDDGSAEVQYGIPDLGAKMAYKFHVMMTDTLRGLQIYFNPSGPDVHNDLFQLAYWSSITVGGSTDNLVYNEIDQKPANVDSINGFATYRFNTQLIIPANTDIYVGLIQNQTEIDTLGIGVDVNTSAAGKMFAYYSGQWFQSQVQGAWMIRPLFGKPISLVGMDEFEVSGFGFEVYPNPVSSSLEIMLDEKSGEKYFYELTDVLGQTILSASLTSHTLDVSNLSCGIYFLKMTEEKSKTSSVRKIVISR